MPMTMFQNLRAKIIFTFVLLVAILPTISAFFLQLNRFAEVQTYVLIEIVIAFLLIFFGFYFTAASIVVAADSLAFTFSSAPIDFQGLVLYFVVPAIFIGLILDWFLRKKLVNLTIFKTVVVFLIITFVPLLALSGSSFRIIGLRIKNTSASVEQLKLRSFSMEEFTALKAENDKHVNQLLGDLRKTLFFTNIQAEDALPSFNIVFRSPAGIGYIWPVIFLKVYGHNLIQPYDKGSYREFFWRMERYY